jgi:hypothetical protein
LTSRLVNLVDLRLDRAQDFTGTTGRNLVYTLDVDVKQIVR